MYLQTLRQGESLLKISYSYGFYPVWVFFCIFRYCDWENPFFKYHILMASFLCEYSYDTSDYVIGWILSYTYYTHVASPLCEYKYEPSVLQIASIFSYKYHTHISSLSDETSYVSTDVSRTWTAAHNPHKHVPLPYCASPSELPSQTASCKVSRSPVRHRCRHWMREAPARKQQNYVY
jgi:hypothetical protein